MPGEKPLPHRGPPEPAGPPPTPAGDAAGRLPLALVTLLAAAPAFAVLPGFADGGFAFTLYREPKLAVAQGLLWSLLVVVAWRRPPWVAAADLRAALARPPVVLFGLFVAWGAATALWVEVPANLFYELIQYLPLAALLAVLVAWGGREPRLRGVMARALAVGLGALTLIGFLQLAVPLPWLPPIDPEYGVANPSLMGYKNPMALALLGQIHLVAWLAAGGSRRRLPWVLLLAAELVYLATLQSRTAYAALALSALLLAVVGGRRVTGRRRVAAVAAAAVCTLLFAVAVTLHPGARARLASAMRHAASPAEYLASDRGAYLLNTVHMVRHRPLGVGLGDWQTWYPLFRRHDRYRSFTETHQVRRAHSDLVQFLGETGWPGLALWMAFLVATVGSALGRFRRRGDLGALFAGVQVAALGFAMGSDYLVEMPYHKLLLVLVAALALIRPPGDAPPVAAAPRRGRLGTTAAAVVTAVAAAAVLWAGATLVRAHLAGGLEHRYLAFLARRTDLDPLAAAGDRLLRWPGHTKTLYRDLLILSHVHALRGDSERAVALARRSLALHPHSPNTLGLLAELQAERDPEVALALRRARRYVMHEANDGLRPALPAGER